MSDLTQAIESLRKAATEILNQRSSGIVQEHRNIFARQRSTNRYTPLQSNRQRQRELKGRTVRRLVVALATTNCEVIPSLAEKRVLYANGLGERLICVPVGGTAEDVKREILRVFPKLETVGGFEFLRPAERSRSQLAVVCSGVCSTDELVGISTRRVYLRPIQVNIPLDEDATMSHEDQTEECLKCNQNIPITRLREHVESCSNYQLEGQATSSNPEIIDDEEDLPDIYPPQNRLQVHSQARTAETVSSIEDIIQKLKDIHDPVQVLKTYCDHYLRGRPLDQITLDNVVEGETNEVSVSRSDVYRSGMEEILSVCSEDLLRLPLEVTFHGEEAQDFGGPRKEFLELMLRALIDEKHRLFKETVNGKYKFQEDSWSLAQRYYYGAGLVCGLSLLQGGPLPCFLDEHVLTGMLSNPTDAGKQFIDGLDALGIVRLMKAKPCVKYLFCHTARRELSNRKLKHLLKPQFAETGSNVRAKQETAYEGFLKYLKEVSAGRRETENGKVNLGLILKFVTACQEEPVLGFQVSPSIQFVEGTTSCLPTSSTCVNVLYLPCDNLPTCKSRLFELYDYAFKNDYFGII